MLDLEDGPAGAARKIQDCRRSGLRSTGLTRPEAKLIAVVCPMLSRLISLSEVRKEIVPVNSTGTTALSRRCAHDGAVAASVGVRVEGCDNWVRRRTFRGCNQP
jgi:hypothetical protein